MWTALIVGLVMSLVSYILTPKPEVTSVEPSKFDSPTIDPNRHVPIVFGTVWLKDPNVVWYGDLSTRPIYPEEGGKK